MASMLLILFLSLFCLLLPTCIDGTYRPISYYYKLNILPEIYELHGKYNSTHTTKRYICRNVPGHGSCLFYALSSCITYERSKQHIDFSKRRMKDMVTNLRKKAVDMLRSKDKELYVENGEKMTSEELLDMVASHFKTTPEKYCDSMLDAGTWGSGTEIVALSNYLKRPIHVYELKVHRNGFLWRRKHFQFRLCAAFGSPVYDKLPPYTILCADGRFPHVSPGSQKRTGDHFLALFPIEEPTFEELRHQAERGLSRQLEVDDWSSGDDEFVQFSGGGQDGHKGAKVRNVSKMRMQNNLRGLMMPQNIDSVNRKSKVTHLAATKVVRRRNKDEDNDNDDDDVSTGRRSSKRDISKTTNIYNILRPFQLPNLEQVRLLHGRIIERYFNSELQRKVLSTPAYQRQQVRPEDLEADEQEFFDPYLVEDNNFTV